MKKEYLVLALFVLFVWASRDKIPAQYRFWENTDTQVVVQNNSGQDLTDVSVVVWSVSHSLGTIKKDKTKSINVPRLRDVTEVVIRFKYGSENVERHAGTLDEDSEYRMHIMVNFAGVVTTQTGAASQEDEEKSK